MIKRTLNIFLKNRLFKGKAIIIVGPRQVGKTTLINEIKDLTNESTIFFNCDEPDIRRLLTDATSSSISQLIGNSKIVFIDEAQRVKNIGLTLKLMTDNFKDKQFIITGSSALELSNDVNEPLTGRKIEYLLLPLSTEELVNHHGALTERRLLHSRLIYGTYPDVVNNPSDAKLILSNLSSSYLYKDIFSFQDVRKPEVIERLLEALALQIGSEVSYTELSQLVGIDYATLLRYIDLLEKTFVVFRLRAFSRNVRNELKKSRKIYFYDNGIRNAIISNFNNIDLRQDTGALWENYLICERFKYLKFNELTGNRYFWRTKQQQEIDYLEENDGNLSAFEFKWNSKRKIKFPLTFEKAYPNAILKGINQENYLDFVTKY
ncbi:MAG: ATP-binding protein [Candidatus Kapabacteria bacterium]|nr:ATP-binding protein [Candidatus Kapabacteria bacterium]